MQLKKETMPDIAIPIVAVVTPYPGAAPGDVYDQVTKPLEKALRGVEGIEELSAQSNDSVSIVITSFSFSQDMDEAERNVNKVLSTVKLPENTVAPTVSRISFGSAPIMKLAVIAEKPEDTAALRADVRDRVIPALQGVQGVGEAKIAADSPAVVKIELDPKKLKKKGLTASGVIDQLKAANLSFPVGTVDLGKTTRADSRGRLHRERRRHQGLQGRRLPQPEQDHGRCVRADRQGHGRARQGHGRAGLGNGPGLRGGRARAWAQLGQATGEVAMQAGLINGIQQVEAQMYSLKYDTLPQLKAAASQMPTRHAGVRERCRARSTRSRGRRSRACRRRDQRSPEAGHRVAEQDEGAGRRVVGRLVGRHRRHVGAVGHVLRRLELLDAQDGHQDGATGRHREGHLRAAGRQRRQPREQQERGAHRHRQDAGLQHRRHLDRTC